MPTNGTLGQNLNAPSIEVSNAQFAYGSRPLFDGLNLVLEAGRWTCVLGPSGVGKSSLLRMIAGLLSGGNDTAVRCGDGSATAGRVAYMAQRDFLLPWLNVVGNATLGARLRGEAVDLDRANALLQAAGVGEAANAMPDELSGGMRQRVALVRTLMEDRPIVLMDEPFSALDAITRLRLQDLAVRLLAKRTVLLVTHDPLEALRLGDRIFVMNGSPAGLGSPLEPAGRPPREAGAPDVLSGQARLLRELAESGK